MPVLKKSSLNPNLPENYRPITVSSVMSKILELLIIPDADISGLQFGFRKGMGTAFGCTMFSDVYLILSISIHRYIHVVWMRKNALIIFVTHHCFINL